VDGVAVRVLATVVTADAGVTRRTVAAAVAMVAVVTAVGVDVMEVATAAVATAAAT
jgi:hypothetical protein